MAEYNFEKAVTKKGLTARLKTLITLHCAVTEGHLKVPFQTKLYGFSPLIIKSIGQLRGRIVELSELLGYTEKVDLDEAISTTEILTAVKGCKVIK